MTDKSTMTAAEWDEASGPDTTAVVGLPPWPLNLDHARAVCAEIGLPFDEEGAADALAAAEIVGLTQEQFDTAMGLHARRVKYLFTPTAYGWRERIAIACHFLFNPRRWRA